MALLKKKSEFMDKFDEYRMTLLAEGAEKKPATSESKGTEDDGVHEGESHTVVRIFFPFVF